MKAREAGGLPLAAALNEIRSPGLSARVPLLLHALPPPLTVQARIEGLPFTRSAKVRLEAPDTAVSKEIISCDAEHVNGIIILAAVSSCSIDT